MRVAIAGAGAVGRSIALELVESEHHVMLIERELRNIDPESIEQAEWVHADACELSSLEEARLCLRRRAVDLVDEHDIREHGAGAELEAVLALVVDVGPDHV